MGSAVSISALSAALQGIAAATRRIEAVSHNVANLQTPDFHPVRVEQDARAGGGVETRVERSLDPEPVELERELVKLGLAQLQARASARVIETELDLIGSLLDIGA